MVTLIGADPGSGARFSVSTTGDDGPIELLIHTSSDQMLNEPEKTRPSTDSSDYCAVVVGQQFGEIPRALALEQGCTVVAVTHDLGWSTFARQTVVLEEGRVLEHRRCYA